VLFNGRVVTITIFFSIISVKGTSNSLHKIWKNYADNIFSILRLLDAHQKLDLDSNNKVWNDNTEMDFKEGVLFFFERNMLIAFH